MPETPFQEFPFHAVVQKLIRMTEATPSPVWALHDTIPCYRYEASFTVGKYHTVVVALQCRASGAGDSQKYALIVSSESFAPYFNFTCADEKWSQHGAEKAHQDLRELEDAIKANTDSFYEAQSLEFLRSPRAALDAVLEAIPVLGEDS